MKTFIITTSIIALVTCALNPYRAEARPRTRDQITLTPTEVGYEVDQAIQLDSAFQLADLAQRRIISAKISLYWNLPTGTMLELWKAAGETYPWKRTGAIPVDRWVMDDRTGDLIQLNICTLLRDKLTRNQTMGSLYLRISEGDRDQIVLHLNDINSLEMIIDHRPRSSP